MTLTDLQRRKFKVAFDSQDLDGSGTLTQEDFDRLIANLQKLSSKNNKAISMYTEMWNNLKSKADTDGDAQVTLEEWYNYIEKLIADKDRFDNYVVSTAGTLLESIDSDGDNNINWDNYKLLAQALNITESEAEIAFKKVDKSGDGVLSITELQEHVKEFYVTTDENSPSNWLFGKF